MSSAPLHCHDSRHLLRLMWLLFESTHLESFQTLHVMLPLHLEIDYSCLMAVCIHIEVFCKFVKGWRIKDDAYNNT